MMMTRVRKAGVAETACHGPNRDSRATRPAWGYPSCKSVNPRSALSTIIGPIDKKITEDNHPPLRRIAEEVRAIGMCLAFSGTLRRLTQHREQDKTGDECRAVLLKFQALIQGAKWRNICLQTETIPARGSTRARAF